MSLADERGNNGSPDEIVGHKTFSDGKGGFRHEPLTSAEADSLWEQVEQARRDRAEKYPTEQECLRAMFDACQRLEELGWKKAEYAPADGKLRPTISLHSTGIHDAYCQKRTSHPTDLGRWWWHPSEGDLWPHKPIYYKPDGGTRYRTVQPQALRARSESQMNLKSPAAAPEPKV